MKMSGDVEQNDFHPPIRNTGETSKGTNTINTATKVFIQWF